MIYDPFDWHWIVGGDESRLWSSASSSWVDTLPKDAGVTRIASGEELTEVLAVYRLRGPVLRKVDYQIAIQAHVDVAAVSRLYNDGNSLAGYVNSTVTSWAAEAAAFVAWRDDVWLYAYAELDKVQAGTRVQPTIAEIIAELPEIVWP